MNTSTYIHSGSHRTVPHRPLRPHVLVCTLDIRPNAIHVLLCDVKMLLCLLLMKHCPIVIDTTLLPTASYLLMSLSSSFCYMLSPVYPPSCRLTTDGAITRVEVTGFQKRVRPEKFYVS